MTHERHSTGHDSAVHWLAYRYLSGDLADAEAVSFEERLADDLALQTALADAVTLTTGLSQLDRHANRRMSPLPPRSASAARWPVGFAAAAMTLMGLGLMLELLTVSTSDVALDEQNVDASSVVALWSALGPDVSDDGKPAGDRRFDHDGDEAEIDVPNWMLLAVLDDAAEGFDAGQEGEPL